MKVLETLIQALFVLVTFVLVVLISLGITLDFEKIKTVTFWIETFSHFCLSMVAFNFLYVYDRHKRMHDKNSRFFKAYATNRLRVKHVEKNKLYDELDKAIAEETFLRLKEKCESKLHRLCTRLSYEDVMSEKDVQELMNDCRVLPKRKPKLEKLILRIRAGEIHVNEIREKVFLTDKELVENKNDNYDFNDLKVELNRNLSRGLAFWGLSIAIAMIGFAFYSPNFLESLLKNFLFVLGGMGSGITSAIQNVKLRTSIYESRNRFFQRRMNIEIEYSEVSNQVSKVSAES